MFFDLLYLAPATLLAVELFFALPFFSAVNKLAGTSKKSLKVISSKKISDHWKEKAVPRYSALVMTASLSGLLYLLLVCLGFMAVYLGLGLLLSPGYDYLMDALASWPHQLVICGIALAYALIRRRSSRGASDYSAMDRLMHLMALGSGSAKKIAYDFDFSLAPSEVRELPIKAPVYVAGLARAGTTILLQALYSCGEFATLTYRDMPFVMAPVFWSRVNRAGQRQAELKERAHGDRVLVNYDSPEAFEEVFWLTFEAGNYLQEDSLLPHDCTDETIDKYRDYLRKLVWKANGDEPGRYLAKNNNNLLRIPSLKKASPQARIIVPFRDPVHHAGSLMAQHAKFIERHGQDAFSLKYMNWLGHHEFGANLKPFRVSDKALPQDPAEPESLPYWLRYWTEVYGFVLENHSDEVIWFDYERFCAKPLDCLNNLAEVLDLDPAALARFADKVKASKKYDPPSQDTPGLDSAYAVYEKLKKLAV